MAMMKSNNRKEIALKMTLKKTICAALTIAIAISGASAQKIISKSPHSDAHKHLLANQAKNKDQIKLIENNTFIDLIDDIEPEPDIYTEGWNSRSVNPFREADVPNRAVIDVTNYHMPVPGQVTSNYGYRAKFRRMHKGIDLAIRSNDTIYAAFDGKVRLTNYEAKGYGNYIIIRHPNDLETVYGHLNRFLVKPEQTVKAGQPIALGGSTGRSTGPHLHFETRYMGYAINPSAIFDFANHTTHTDTYTFSKATYTQARNYAPSNVHANSVQEIDAAMSRNSAKSNSKSAKTSKKSDSTSKSAAPYKVRKGDTLSSIAKKNGTTVAKLQKLNGLGKSSTLQPGQSLKVK
jgi:murein DD-endopeptidase MepM/ murein hydrolase activator NlpD